MKRILLFVGASIIGTVFVAGTSVLSSASQSTQRNKHKANAIPAIRAVLDAQVAAWNRGDIDGVMKGYWRSESTVFVSGDSVTYGWNTVRDRYKKGYETREKMGTLEFSDLKFNVIRKDAVVVHGTWQLTRVNDKPRGRFTLIFRRTRQGWRIVHDHTSSA